MSFLQQLVQLLSEAPGSIVYHVLTLWAVFAILGLALWQRRRDPADELAGRLAWAAAGVLFNRLIVVFVVLSAGNQAEANSVLPPLEQAIDAATAALFVWALAPPIPGFPRLGSVILLFILLSIGIMFAFDARDWAAQVASGRDQQGYNSFPQAAVWGIFQMTLLGLGSLLVLLGRQQQWTLRLAVLAILFLAHLAHFWNSPEIIPTGTDISYWVRLGNLIALPLLAALAYRHNLAQLLATQRDSQPPVERTIQQLHLSRQVIDSPDSRQTINQSLILAARLTDVAFVALAALLPDDPATLQVTSLRLQSSHDQRANDLAVRQSWALALSDWPAFRLAMQQRQRVELIPDGLGARQLEDFYRELGLSSLGALLIEPLVAPDVELGVLLLAGPAGQGRWTTESKLLSHALAGYIAQALYNNRRYQDALTTPALTVPISEAVVSGRLIALEEERNRALAEVELLTGRWQRSEAQLLAESQRTRSLAATLEEMEQLSRDDKVAALEEEIKALRESLIEAEDAMAMAAAGEGGLSPEWVTLAITRYSGELEEAHSRIHQLEMELNKKEPSTAAPLVMGLAQELRTPLTSLAGYTDLLLSESMGILSAKQIGLMRRIKANVEHMIALLDQLIQLTGPEQPQTYKTPVDVRLAIESAVTAVSDRLREKNLRLDLKIDEQLPPVLSDGNAIQQIMTTLLDNACWVSAQGGRLVVSAHHDAIQEPAQNGAPESFGFLHLAVTDSGKPDSDIRFLVLDSHRQSREVSLAHAAGTGERLSSALNLIAAHGGRAWMNREAGGNTFSVLLPLSNNGVAGGAGNG
ncbi:MAG: GAF domain-containing sensor histidine kinase [Chloroflexi bacterium]|nr:GAF domain-containing sensor histidine kinase [Chloroflexota bacterium]MCI0644947.1 GAF domain-containing sensor histidine kinase [Chloroflexota bacterium]MCI0726633.1 GAF domain-containing sensor histidine kinase [Chloroflexota bacterium]